MAALKALGALRKQSATAAAPQATTTPEKPVAVHKGIDKTIDQPSAGDKTIKDPGLLPLAAPPTAASPAPKEVSSRNVLTGSRFWTINSVCWPSQLSVADKVAALKALEALRKQSATAAAPQATSTTEEPVAVDKAIDKTTDQPSAGDKTIDQPSVGDKTTDQPVEEELPKDIPK